MADDLVETAIYQELMARMPVSAIAAGVLAAKIHERLVRDRWVVTAEDLERRLKTEAEPPVGKLFGAWPSDVDRCPACGKSRWALEHESPARVGTSDEEWAREIAVCTRSRATPLAPEEKVERAAAGGGVTDPEGEIEQTRRQIEAERILAGVAKEPDWRCDRCGATATGEKRALAWLRVWFPHVYYRDLCPACAASLVHWLDQPERESREARAQQLAVVNRLMGQIRAAVPPPGGIVAIGGFGPRTLLDRILGRNHG